MSEPDVSRIWKFLLQKKCPQRNLESEVRLPSSSSFNLVYGLSSSRFLGCFQKNNAESLKLLVPLLFLWEMLEPVPSKVHVIKFLEYILAWYMDFFTLSYLLQYAKKEGNVYENEHNITQGVHLVSLVG